MAITQWSPFSEFVGLREAMDRLLSESMVRPNGQHGRTATPAYDLFETEDGLTFRFALPGVRPEDVEITFNQGMLVVKGGQPAQEPSEAEQKAIWHVRGLSQSGTFQYSFRLPYAVDAGQAEATAEHGILTVTLPKAETAKPQRIAIAAPAEGSAR